MSELSDFHLGYPKMDRDHEILFDLFGELEAVTRTRVHDRLESTFLSIRAHLDAQFDSESTLMQEHFYPGLSEHEQQHEEIRAQLECVTMIIRRGYTAAAAYGGKMVAMSIVYHLNTADRELAQYLLSHDASLRQSFRLTSNRAV